MLYRRLLILFCTLLALCPASNAHSLTLFQRRASKERVIRISLQNVDIYDGIKLLFEKAQIPYSLESVRHAQVISVNLQKPFTEVLDALLKMSEPPLTYWLENGIYYLSRLEPSASLPVHLDVDNVEAYFALGEVFKQICKQTQENYVLDRAFHKPKVTAHFTKPLREVVETIIKNMGMRLKYVEVDGVHCVIPIEPPKKIRLRVEREDLYEALNRLCQEAESVPMAYIIIFEHQIDPALHGVKISVRIHDSFVVAMKKIARAAKLPIVYHFENGVCFINLAPK